MIVYLSGPMRGKPDYNYPTFTEVEQSAREYFFAQDAEILNPAKNFNGDVSLPVSTYMQKDLEQVLSADALVLLPGWEQSEGAKLEVSVAKGTGKKFYQAVQIDDGHRLTWCFVEMDEPAEVRSPRAQSLDRAKSYITGDRNAAYGSPTQDFARTAAAWTAYGYRGPDGRDLRSHDVALMMIMLKASRLMWSPERADSWDDIAGYSACGYECVVETGKDAA